MIPIEWLFPAFIANIVVWGLWEWCFPRRKIKAVPTAPAKPNPKTELDAMLRIATLLSAARRHNAKSKG